MMKKNNFNFFILLVNLMSSIFICIFLFWLFANNDGTFGKIVFLPFLLCSFCFFWKIVAKIMGYKKLEKYFYKFYVFIFLMYWIGFILLYIYMALINHNFILLLYSIPFVIGGIDIAYKNFKKKK